MIWWHLSVSVSVRWLTLAIIHQNYALFKKKEKKEKVFHVVEGSNKAIYLRKLYFQQANLEDLKGRLLGFNQNLW